MVVTNTWFKLPKRRLYTWKSPLDSADNPVRNQIDYVLINKRFRNTIKRITTYPGADIGSDHNPLVADMVLSLKTVKRRCVCKKIDTYGLHAADVKAKVKRDLNTRLNQMTKKTNNNNVDMNTRWSKLKQTVLDVSVQHLKAPVRAGRKSWMTDDILALMERRRLLKNNPTEYGKLQTAIRKEIKGAKQCWMAEKYEEMEDLISKHDIFNIYSKVKKIAELYNKHRLGCL